MGWTSAPSWKSVDDVVREELPAATFAYAIPPEESKRGEAWAEQRVLASALHGSEYGGQARLWLVCEQSGHASKGAPALWSERYVLLKLIERRGGLAVKVMDEHSGPCFYDCPVGFLDIADPLDARITYAQAWRSKVREFWASDVRPIVRTMRIPEVSTAG